MIVMVRMLQVIRLFVVGIMVLMVAGCDSSDTRINIITVRNVGDTPFYVEITAENVVDAKKSLNLSFPVSPGYETSYYDEEWFMSKNERFRNCPKIKFVIMACNDDLSCNEEVVIEVIEMNQEQFFHLHQSLYYPLSDHDRSVLEQYK